MPIYKNQSSDSNKFWEYEVTNQDPPTVTFKWGRYGRSGQQSTKQFSNKRDMDLFINKKVNEKIRKKYILSSEDDKNKENKRAEILGTQFKIQHLQYVKKPTEYLSGFQADVLPQYDPRQFVYVEVRNSWNKTSEYYLLGKNESYTTSSASIEGRTCVFDSLTRASQNRVKAVRQALLDIFKEVQRVVRKIGLGLRRLSIGDDDPLPEQEEQFEEVYRSIDSSISKQVVRQITALGQRTLDI